MPYLNPRQIAMVHRVLKHNDKIADVADEFGVSKSTVHRYLDRYWDEKEEKKNRTFAAMHLSGTIRNEVKKITQSTSMYTDAEKAELIKLAERLYETISVDTENEST